MLRSALTRLRPAIVTLLCLGALPLNAIIFYSTDDPSYNTQPPTGVLTNSGWQWQGQWLGFLGTPIAPRYFITAEHIQGSVGSVFVYHGVNYSTTAVFDDPQTDLRIWRVCGEFPDYAPLYTATNEVGKSLLAFGRGTLRAAPVTTTNLFQVKTNGWIWGGYDGVTRWGENEVASIVDGNSAFETGIGELLTATFDAGAGPNECDFSVGDSAGAVFILDGAGWKLAGINYAVDGPYNWSATGEGFYAAIFDQGGLYTANGPTWVLTPPLPIPQPGSFYSTRISTRVDWINSVLSSPVTDDSQPTVQSAPTPAGTYADIIATVDALAKTITIPQPTGPQFYRLRACVTLHINSIQLQNGNLVLSYE